MVICAVAADCDAFGSKCLHSWAGSSQMASAEFPGTVETYLLEVFAEGNPQAAIPSVEHLTGHEGVEDGRAHQRHAEVEAEEPPVLHVLVKLSSEEKGR